MVILAQPHEREDDVAALATQLKISPQRARTALERAGVKAVEYILSGAEVSCHMEEGVNIRRKGSLSSTGVMGRFNGWAFRSRSNDTQDPSNGAEGAPESGKRRSRPPLLSLSSSSSIVQERPLMSIDPKLDAQASELIRGAVARGSTDNPTTSRRTTDTDSLPSSSSSPPYALTKKSIGNMFSGLTLTREKSNMNDDNKERELRTKEKSTFFGNKHQRSSSFSRQRGNKDNDEDESRKTRSRARSTSPFAGRFSNRDPSPAVEALRMSQSEAELSEAEESSATAGGRKSSRRSFGVRRSSFFSRNSTDDESSSSDSSDSDDEVAEPGSIVLAKEGINAPFKSTDSFDILTERNTEQNALLSLDANGDPLRQVDDLDDSPDPLGEGNNVVRPEEPLFVSTLMGTRGRTSGSAASNSASGPKESASANSPQRGTGLKRKKTAKTDRLELHTSRPSFQRDKCTVVLTHGDPAGWLTEQERLGNSREPRRYVVASDLSLESSYAVEWGIGTVLRDGDYMVLVSVQETESKLDPEPNAPALDRVAKLRNQQERQALAYLLVRQVTSLLQRTKLQCTVFCQALHAKNARHLLTDLIDYTEPSMVIVGSRGVGQLKGILLGSTSHYLIQKSSVPVMVARRRLRRPAKHTAHLQPRSPAQQRSLSEAVIDKTGPGKLDKDVEHMREELQKEETEEVEMAKHGIQSPR